MSFLFTLLFWVLNGVVAWNRDVKGSITRITLFFFFFFERISLFLLDDLLGLRVLSSFLY